MSQSVITGNMVNEQLETAINIGCTMVSRSKEMRKKLSSSSGRNANLKKSLKELDKMSAELVDKLFEINARIDLSRKSNKFRFWLEGILNRARKSIEKMRLTYQDIYTL